MTAGKAALGGLINCHSILFPRFNEPHANDLRLHGKENLQTEGGGEGRRDIFRVFQIQGLHSALEAGFKKLKQVVRSVACGLILMRQEAERGIESAWVTGRRGDRFFFVAVTGCRSRLYCIII